MDEHVKNFNDESAEQTNAQTYTHVCSIRFKGAKKAYTFGTNDPQYETGDQVIVDTIRGLELGEVIAELRPLEKISMSTPLKPVLRKATKQDLDNFERNKAMSVDAMKTCEDSIRKLGLDMHLISAEYTLDRSKVIFSYVADERVDFRELLKELASIFKCRIELRQIGPRDKAKFIGGLGTCGMETCCSRFLPDFDVISINMAKNQLLALNIQKLSGQCGKLLCCLKYEDELYKELRANLPKMNELLEYKGKKYRVSSMNVLSGTARLENRDESLTLTLNELRNDTSYVNKQ